MNSKIESKIASVEYKYRSMTDKFIDAVWVIDASALKYLYISPDIYKLRGFTQQELIGSELRKNIVPESYEKLSILFKKGKKDWESGINKSYSLDVELYHKNGSTVWIEISAKFFMENDNVLKIVGITRNIDKRKKAEQKQQETNRALKKALREKNELLKKVKTLETLLPICSGCRRIRDENNKWWPLEKYVEKKADSKFTHTICPDCVNIYFPDK